MFTESEWSSDDTRARLTSWEKPTPPAWWILRLPPVQNGPCSASADGRGTAGVSTQDKAASVCFKSHDATCLFKDDVNVSGNQLGYLLPLCSLHRVVTLLVFSKILWRAWKGEGIQANIYDPSGPAEMILYLMRFWVFLISTFIGKENLPACDGAAD